MVMRPIGWRFKRYPAMKCVFIILDCQPYVSDSMETNKDSFDVCLSRDSIRSRKAMYEPCLQSLCKAVPILYVFM